MNNKNINKIKKSLVETMSPQALLQEMVPLCVQIMRLLVEGSLVSPDQIASICHNPIDEVDNHLSNLQRIGMAELDDNGNVVGMILSLNTTRHSFRVKGNNLFTWCAIDTLFLPAVLNQSADVESICPITNAKINLIVTPEGIEKVNPSGTCLSIVAPGITKGTTASCGTNGSCASDTLTGTQGPFCSNVHFFSSYEAASKWLTNFEGGCILSTEEAYKLAYDVWAKPFLDSDETLCNIAK